MFGADRDALLCDLAETYHIYDFRALPVELLATLCSGLRADSRIRMKMAGVEELPLSLALAGIADRLAMIHYAITASEGDTPPASIVQEITTKPGKQPSDEGFIRVRDKIYEDARRSIEGE